MSKLCPKCNQTLDDRFFAVRSNGKLQAYCRECKREIDREYQKSKRDKVSETIETLEEKEITEDIQTIESQDLPEESVPQNVSITLNDERDPWYKRFPTGRTDKNGKMIHEGDTIRWVDWVGDAKDYLIKWRDDDFHLEFIAEQVRSSMYSCLPREWINAEIVGGGPD